MKKEVQIILEDNAHLFDEGNFTTAFESALNSNVATDLLDNLYEADVSAPTEQLTTVLKKHYIDNNPTLTPKEKVEKETFIQYLINRYQISIFESVMKTK